MNDPHKKEIAKAIAKAIAKVRPDNYKTWEEKPTAQIDRKRLTEFLGECWHNYEDLDKFGPYRRMRCSKCKKYINGVYYTTISDIFNRTFATPDDFLALKDKLEEKGKWLEFDEWAYMQWDSLKPFNDLSRHLGEQSDWLINAPRFCWLVNEWLKEMEAKP